ncbi:MAG TPA: ACT domain-containing protein [Thermoanaerobaculia bacterium]|nr:ACT domain-containing protein [Thermoanaerobaculia bacterium]
MPAARLDLIWLPGLHAVCRLGPKAAAPDWAAGRFVSSTRTADELSIVCEFGGVPDEVRQEGPYAMFRVAGSLELGLTGILASLASPLAAAGIPIFALSTFDTDYVLVRERDRARAETTLTAAGHRFVEPAESS